MSDESTTTTVPTDTQHAIAQAMLADAAQAATKLQALAAIVRANPQARDAIADGFELIAAQLLPCEDCIALMNTIAPEDNPATGGGTTALEGQPGII